MDRIKSLITSSKSVKWLFYGDSITQGCYHTYGYRDYTELFAERVRFEMQRKADIVINTAVSGSTSKDLNLEFNWRVAQFKPHVVFLMMGINDCTSEHRIGINKFCENIYLLIDKMITIGSQPVLQTPNTIIMKNISDELTKLSEYADVVRKISQKENIALIDHFAYWQTNHGKSLYWMNDALHPNKFGHIVLARVVFESLSISSDHNVTSKLFIP